MFRHGTCFRGPRNIYLELAASIRTNNNQHEIKKKMKKFEISVQKEIVDRALQVVNRIVLTTGGLSRWQKSRPKDRKRIFRQKFATNPVLISNTVFETMGKKVEFSTIFASNEPSSTLRWQRFTQARFVELCSAVYNYIVD